MTDEQRVDGHDVTKEQEELILRMAAHIWRIMSDADCETVAELARKTGVDESTFYKTLHLEKALGLETIIKLSEADPLGSIDYIVKKDPPERWMLKARLESLRVRSRRAKRAGDSPTKAPAPARALGRSRDRAELWRRRFPRVSVNLDITSPEGIRFHATDMSPGGLGVQVLGGAHVKRGETLALSVGDSDAATYTVAWSNGPRAGLKLLQ